jgi:methylmalonyl-CoA mutase
MVKKEKLFDQFPPVSTKEWMDKITADLKGADFNKKLVWKTNDGLDVNPFYRMEDIENLAYISCLPGQFPYVRGKKIRDNSWLIRQNIEVTDYSEANRKALDILMKGVDSLGFIIADPESVNEENFDKLLKDILPEAVELNFLSNGKAKEIIEIIRKHVANSGTDPVLIRGAFEADPLGRLMLNGTLCIPPDKGFDYLASVVELASSLPNFRTIHLNASNFTNAGAGIVQELAFGISMGSEYLAQLTQRGIGADLAASKIRFSFGTGSEYFPEIAKLRAARLLWSAVVKGYNTPQAESIKMDIHSVTSQYNKTVYDPYVNMLRTQTEAMSAILGGTDSLTVEPFDIVFRKPDEFSERIARNQQLILREEAYFDKVADPAAGSYYIENLTNMLAESAWNLFVKLEEQGGFLACLNSGVIQGMLAESSKKRANDIATRKTILLGTNQYPDRNEKISAAADPEKIFKGKAADAEKELEPVKLSRGSEKYDRIRIAVEKAAKRPKVFLLQLGSQSMRKARAQFAANLFGCAGYEVADNQGFDSVDQACEAAVLSKAEIVVICSSDEEYPLIAPQVFAKLRDKALIVVAGNPPCLEELKAAGIEYFIHLRSNVISTLLEFNNKLGIF